MFSHWSQREKLSVNIYRITTEDTGHSEKNLFAVVSVLTDTYYLNSITISKKEPPHPLS